MYGVSASHVPILVYLAKHYPIKTVLEVGSGELSTKLFLDKNIYKDLIFLTSIEEDEHWFKKILALYTDKRFSLVDRFPPSFTGYDLIFIDGPEDKTRRGKVIQYIMRDLINALIVIHNVDNKYYWRFISNKYYEFVFNAVDAPQIGIYSKIPFRDSELKRVNRTIRKNFKNIEEDWTKWSKVL